MLYVRQECLLLSAMSVGIVLKRYHQHQLLTTPTRYRYYSPTKDAIA